VNKNQPEREVRSWISVLESRAMDANKNYDPPFLRVYGDSHRHVKPGHDEVSEDPVSCRRSDGDPVVARVRPVEGTGQPVDGHPVHQHRRTAVSRGQFLHRESSSRENWSKCFLQFNSPQNCSMKQHFDVSDIPSATQQSLRRGCPYASLHYRNCLRPGTGSYS